MLLVNIDDTKNLVIRILFSIQSDYFFKNEYNILFKIMAMVNKRKY